MERTDYLFLVMGILLFVSILWEASIIYQMYANADEVTCNWLWCEFKETKRTIEQNTITEINQQCFRSGIEINCSELEEYPI